MRRTVFRSAVWVPIGTALISAIATVLASSTGIVPHFHHEPQTDVRKLPDYHVKIDRPGPGEPVHSTSFRMSGETDSLPKDFQLWVVTIDPNRPNEYYPINPVVFDKTDPKRWSWTIDIKHDKWEAGQTQHHRILIVGQDGQMLVRDHLNVLNTLLYKEKQEVKDKKWMPLTTKTSDMAECTEDWPVRFQP